MIEALFEIVSCVVDVAFVFILEIKPHFKLELQQTIVLLMHASMVINLTSRP